MDRTDGRDSGGVRPLYGRFAWAYDLVVARPAGGSVEQVARMLVGSGTSCGSLVLDAGCGTGRYAEGLAAFGFRVIGLDRSEALIEQARARSSGAVFVCADLLAWRPPEVADAVLCRGVLNDLTADSERRSVFAILGSWLGPDGVLLADVREWEATAVRYANEPPHAHSVNLRGRTLQFSSATTLDSGRHLMQVHEHYVGTVDGIEVNESCDFEMRCWTAEELRSYIAAAGFTDLELRRGAEAGIAPDRLLVVARR
jgi:SAM-dependent methyltransferase